MMTLEKAKKALSLAEQKAQELKIAVSIALVDENGIPVASVKMDGAISVSPKFALAKAYTSGTTGMATAAIASYSAPGKPYYHIDTLFGGELTAIAGGVPVMENGKLIGGIGVGGPMDVSQDAACAESALAAFT